MSLGVNSVNLGVAKGVTFGNGEVSQQPMNEGEKKGLSTTTKVVTGLAALALLGTVVYYGMRGKANAASKAAGEAAEKAGEAAGKGAEEVAEAAGEAASKAGEEVAEAAGEAASKAGEEVAEAAGEAAGKAGEEVAEAAGEAAGKAGEEAAEKAGEAAGKAGQAAGKANPLSSLHRKSTIAASVFNADDAKSIGLVNKTYDEVVAGLKENLDLSADEVKKLDSYINQTATKFKNKMNAKFEPGSEDAKIAQELKDYYTKHSLMTPEIFAKFAFLDELSKDSITKENLLKILQFLEG